MVSPLDAQRLFLQSVISRRVLSADLAKVLWKQCVEAVKGLVLALLGSEHTAEAETRQLQMILFKLTRTVQMDGASSWPASTNHSIP